MSCNHAARSVRRGRLRPVGLGRAGSVLVVALMGSGCITEEAPANDSPADTASTMDASGGLHDGGLHDTPADAAVSASCLDVDPSNIAFGLCLTQATSYQPIGIKNCGERAVLIDSIRLSDDSDPEFQVTPPVAEAFEVSPQASTDSDPDLTPIYVAFLPTADGEYSGTLIIESDDPMRPSALVPISATSLPNQCPIGAVDPMHLTVHVLDVVGLNGGPSADLQGGSISTYEWEVVERPEGSLSFPVERFADSSRPQDGGQPDDPSTPTARFFGDMVGTFIVELRVGDNFGLMHPSEACPGPGARVQIDVVP